MKHIAFTTTLLTLSLGSVSSLQADVTDAQMRSPENRVSAMEQKKGSTSMINPPGTPHEHAGARRAKRPERLSLHSGPPWLNAFSPPRALPTE